MALSCAQLAHMCVVYGVVMHWYGLSYQMVLLRIVHSGLPPHCSAFLLVVCLPIHLYICVPVYNFMGIELSQKSITTI